MVKEGCWPNTILCEVCLPGLRAGLWLIDTFLQLCPVGVTDCLATVMLELKRLMFFFLAYIILSDIIVLSDIIRIK